MPERASPREPPFGGRMGEEPPLGGGGGGQGDSATAQGVGEWFWHPPGSPPPGGGWGRERPLGRGRGRAGGERGTGILPREHPGRR